MDLISLILSALFVGLIIPAIISTVYHQYILRQKLKNLPQKGGFPFGMIFEYIKRTNYERLLLTRQNMLHFKEGIFVNWFGIKPFINLYKPELLEIILPSTMYIEKGNPYKFLDSWLGKGLLTSTGKQWFHDRKLISPTFHFNILDKFAIVILENRDSDKMSRERITTIQAFINKAALDVICETAMGVNIRAQEVETKYTATIHRSSKLLMDRFFRPWQWPNWLYVLMPIGKEYESGINNLHKFTREVINKRKIARQLQNDSAKSENKDDEFNIGKQKRKAFLDVLLDQNEKDETPLTDDELRAQVDTFMFEGHDTTAVAISWTLFLLGNNLDQQEKVHKELEEVFEDSKTPASVKKLSQLKYLDMAIKESLRLYPSVPIILRQLSQDIKLSNYTLPKGATVSIQIAFMHRNPQIWPDSTKFDPDRFLPENSKHRHPYAYIPFSAGPRNCIGKRFALLEEKIILTAILRKWRLKSVKATEAVQYETSIILRPCEKIFIHFTPKK
ncbi:cytochrome P450 4C1-like isoform X1 [Nylanderia fulva]|uniref:cytochrome P450 4C1-like isoform X1 n=1 Tax=Nylanderia fulva TaxID=613905 RepID=UPI0010FADE50|nr:cytochrome P450 4C1-like isoform X1 [Nylanderia fulva]